LDALNFISPFPPVWREPNHESFALEPQLHFVYKNKFKVISSLFLFLFPKTPASPSNHFRSNAKMADCGFIIDDTIIIIADFKNTPPRTQSDVSMAEVFPKNHIYFDDLDRSRHGE
jgi:hypothetical protein